jgi:phosphoribosylcarboxyaminoimidazole (NCAIR) mutase
MVTCWVACCARIWVPVAAQPYSEDAVKAAFLCRFGSFVTWPEHALDREHFTIAVLDDDAVASNLERLSLHETILNRPLTVRRIHSDREANGAQILYVGATHRGELANIIAAAVRQPVLIVTNEDGALDAGSAVNFMVIDQRVRFEIAMQAVTRSGLNIGSELLSVAVRVRGGGVKQ